MNYRQHHCVPGYPTWISRYVATTLDEFTAGAAEQALTTLLGRLLFRRGIVAW